MVDAVICTREAMKNLRPGVTAEFSATPAAGTSRGAPVLGEHTQAVLTSLAGYSLEEVAGLKEAGAI